MQLNQEELQNLSDLLLSVDDNNTRLAFEIMNKEIASNLFTEIFVVQKLSSAKDLKDKAYEFLLEQTEVDIGLLMDTQVMLGQRGQVIPTEKTIRKNIEFYVALSNGHLNGEKMALALYYKYGVGLNYLLSHLSEPLKVSLLKSFITGTSFKLTACSLTKIPDELYQFTTLTEIDLSKNKIKTIPAKIKVFQALEILNVSENQLNKLNKALAKLPQLKTLNISMNKFKEFPPVLEDLLELEVLNITTLHYTMLGETYKVPPKFTALKKLKKIILDENYGSYFRHRVSFNLQDYPNFTTIEAKNGLALDLSPMELAIYAYRENGRSEGVYYIFKNSEDSALIKEIIDAEYYEAKTKTLNLKSSIFPDLPKEMADYEIQHLDFDDSNMGIMLYDAGLYQRYYQVPFKKEAALNQLFALFAKNTSMQTVSLGSNQLRSLPAILFEWKEMKTLNLRDNKIKALPDQMEALAALESLDLHKNEFQTLPSSFKLLQNLKYLDVGENPFDKVPEEIGYLSNLEVLHYRNPLADLDPKTAAANIPASFAGLKNLKKIVFYVDGMYYNEDNCKEAYQARLEALLPKDCEITFD